MPITYSDLNIAPLVTLPSNLVIVGPIEQFQHITTYNIFVEKNLLTSAGLELIQSLSERLSPSYDRGSSVETFITHNNQLQRLALCAIPTGCSRHNAPGRPHAVTDLIRANKSSGDVAILLLNENPSITAFSTGCAVARAFSTYSFKKKSSADQNVSVYYNHKFEEISPALSFDCSSANHLASSIQQCQNLVDMPPNILHTDAYADIVRGMVAELQSLGHNVGIEVIRGEELVARGLNGLYGVGKSATHPSCLVHLSYVPPTLGGGDVTPGKSICLVGKGITYDTGGLSLKTKEGMPGMKRDMGGSAGVVCAFRSLVLDGSHLASATPTPIHALLCIAENGIGPNATRPDDIHVMYSGKTVEINNTDAEGRLVLSDGCAFAAKHLNPEIIIDMATLTGAQGIATGKRHGALYCSDEELERYAVQMGKFSGDLAHPLPYCPEFFAPEFNSAVADMKNSVACRSNAQSSCAGQFIGNHIDSFIAEGGKWLHIDMAYPSEQGERATGYGVGLLYSMVRGMKR